MLGREKECENIDYESKLDSLWPKKVWSFSPESYTLYDRADELEIYKGLCSKSRLNEMELYSTLRIYQQIEKDSIDAPTDEEYANLLAAKKTKEDAILSLEKSNLCLMRNCLDKADALQDVYQQRVDLVKQVRNIADKTRQVEKSLATVNSQVPQDKSEETKALQQEAKLLEAQLKTLFKEVDEEEELTSGLNSSIGKCILDNEKLEKSLGEANLQLQAYQQAYEQGNPDLAELDLWLETGIELTQKLNQVYQVEAHGFNHLEVVFDISPMYPCLIIKHTDFSEGFDISFLKVDAYMYGWPLLIYLKLTRTYIDPTRSKESKLYDTAEDVQWKSSYEDFEEILDIDLQALLDKVLLDVPLNNDHLIPELVGATYQELDSWLTANLDQL
ncbi:hypothetical protein DSO57_1034897 [Entomophthora muscae]|uniref:Uncharacterized protein n=1 Tax=Entomophthora muscae TaxID=34485 RepID=A0ACC2SZQ1_9FUNG|nr:hypothetical protein DSO57_1034897 [Entomophthora muscae]